MRIEVMCSKTTMLLDMEDDISLFSKVLTAEPTLYGSLYFSVDQSLPVVLLDNISNFNTPFQHGFLK